MLKFPDKPAVLYNSFYEYVISVGVKCTSCFGSKYINDPVEGYKMQDPCRTCNGSGKLNEDQMRENYNKLRSLENRRLEVWQEKVDLIIKVENFLTEKEIELLEQILNE